MKVCISLRCPAPTDLRSGNLRGEPRWERQVLEACTSNSEITDIYTTGYIWSGGPKYRGPITDITSPSTILIMQDWNNSVLSSYRWKGALINIFSGPWIFQLDEVKQAYNLYANKLAFTIGFPSIINDKGSIEYLLQFLPREHIFLLPVPGIPGVVNQNNFKEKSIIFANRLIYLSQLSESAMIHWAFRELEKDKTLTLSILTGWETNEIKNNIGPEGSAVIINDTLENSFWGLEAFKKYLHLKPQIELIYNLSWGEILERYRHAKLLLTLGKYNGGAPIEAGMFGVPFVAYGNSGIMKDCDGYLYGDKDKEVCDLLDSLVVDEELYIKTSNAYRKYVKDNYTYEVFNNNLNTILKTLGLDD